MLRRRTLLFMRDSPGQPPGTGSGLATGSVLTLVVLGLPDGMLGVAWPSLRGDFGQPLAALGELLVASMAGYLTVTSLTGSALRRFGSAMILVGSAGLAAAATAVFFTARWWPAMVGASLLIGAAGGGLDAAVNTVVALTGRIRLMNLIHAAFGAGAALGPLVVTAAVAARSSWRGAYGLLCALQASLMIIWFGVRGAVPLTRRGIGPDSPGTPPAAAAQEPSASSGAPGSAQARSSTRIPFIRLSLALFFCYGGAEITAASWSATYLIDREQVSPALAGMAVFAFWAGLTTGRLIPAALGHRLPARNAALAGTVGAAAGASGVWANLSPQICVLSLIVVGVCLGPIFPALVSLTPNRLGRSAAISAVGWQLAATGIGGSGLSALTGLVLQQTSLASFGPVLLLLTGALVTLNAVLGHQADDRAASPGTPNASGSC